MAQKNRITCDRCGFESVNGAFLHYYVPSYRELEWASPAHFDLCDNCDDALAGFLKEGIK